MDPESMKDVVRNAMGQGFNTGNLDLMHNFIHDDYIRHGSIGSPGVNSLVEHQQELANRRTVFADAKFEILDIIAEGDRVVVRMTMTGRHVGTFHGIAPTGRVVWREAGVFFKFRDGKIAECWAVIDLHGFLARIRGEAD